jgi:hypothetical protein
MRDEAMMMAFDGWINQPENGRVPGYWAMLAFAAGWEARGEAMQAGASPDQDQEKKG